MQRLQEARSELLKAIMLCTAMSGCITDIIDIKGATELTAADLHKIANRLSRIGVCAEELGNVITTALTGIGDYGKDEFESFGL